MHFGLLRQRLTVQRKITAGSQSGSGFVAGGEWVDWKVNVPCGVAVRRGQEHYAQTGEGGQRFSKDMWLFTVRYPSVEGIDSTMRVLHRGNIYDIRHIRPDAAYLREMVLECEVQDAVIGAAPLTPSISMAIPAGTVGAVYEGFTVSVTGGTAPYTFVVDSGGLLPGLDIDAATGAVSGTPTVDGAFECEVTIMDSVGSSAVINFTVTIAPAVDPAAYSYTITAGQDSQFVGYVMGDIGSISDQPINGATVYSTAAGKAVAGSGKIEVIGDRGALEPFLSDKEVWIDGVMISDETNWVFDTYQATWSVTSDFPNFTAGNDYLVEFK